MFSAGTISELVMLERQFHTHAQVVALAKLSASQNKVKTEKDMIVGRGVQGG